jgi:hypothetical protein
MTKSSILATVAAAVFIGVVKGHGHLSVPKPVFVPGTNDPTKFCGLIDGNSALPGGSYSSEPALNTISFTEKFKASQYKTLQDLVKLQQLEPGAKADCGFTDPSNQQPLPDQIEWKHGDGEGFTPSHHGPCEAWCDDERVFQNDDCVKNFPGIPAKLPYAKDKCTGKKQLKFIWLAQHTASWQVYINCVGIAGSGAAIAPAPAMVPTVAPSPSSVTVPSTAPVISSSLCKSD